MSSIKNKRIAIVGGGPGGLTLARLLQMNGADVKVYERDANRNVRVQGATLDLHYESGLRALRAAGLMDEFNANYRPGADRMIVTDKNAKVMHEDSFAEEQPEEFARPEIDRGPLRDILLDSLKDDTVVWDSQFTLLKVQDDDTVNLFFKNGSTAEADLVIGADGANSKIRPYITPIKAIYSGVTCIESAVYDSAENSPVIHELLQGGKIFALGDSKSFVVSAKGDGSLNFYLGFKKPESWITDNDIDFTNQVQVIAWFKQEYAGWGDTWDELLINASQFILRPQYYMPLDQDWESLPNLTMLGDAAHVMPPYAGEGVNMAMLDSLELAEYLLDEKYTDTHSAIEAYETQMRARATIMETDTLQQTEALHSPDGLQYLVDMFNQK
jgi:2-polyprenyl-6-methoxyphenol hydroxylase-like FAD-dependent oxidoreductase